MPSLASDWSKDLGLSQSAHSIFLSLGTDWFRNGHRIQSEPVDVQGIFWKSLEVLVGFSYQMWTSRQADAVLGRWPMAMKEILLRKSDPQKSECWEGNYPVLEDISEPLSQPILKACFPVLSIPGQATTSVYAQSSPQSVMDRRWWVTTSAFLPLLETSLSILSDTEGFSMWAVNDGKKLSVRTAFPAEALGRCRS